jgi:predicted transcriptional regulator of viral defense system
MIIQGLGVNDARKKALAIIRAHGGSIRTRDALEAGIHPRTLYALRDEGELERLSRGLYRLADLPPVGDPDLALVAGRIPQGVLCLISALAIHGLTTQIPHRVHLAIPRSARYPAIDHPLLQVYRYSRPSFEAGIETRDIGGAVIRLYDREKTIADAFKYRNKIGLDLALEALRNYLAERGKGVQRILEYARINRIDKIIRPYLEALL